MVMTAKAREIKKKIADLQRQLEEEVDLELSTVRSAHRRYQQALHLCSCHFSTQRFEDAIAAGFEFKRLGEARLAAERVLMYPAQILPGRAGTLAAGRPIPKQRKKQWQR